MSNVVINSDKTISINGVKTFPVGVYAGLWCYTPYGCDPQNTQDYLFWAIPWLDAYPTSYNTFNNIIPTFDSNNVFLTAPFPQPSDRNIDGLTSASINNNHFFGYIQTDEPDVWNIPASTLINRYNIIKSRDTAHPVITTVFRNLWTYKDTADILMWDTYTVGTAYPRAEAPYWYEIISRYNAFAGHSVGDFTKPIYAIVQAYGIDTPQYSLQTLTAAEVRLMTYVPITMGMQGIVYYGYHTGDTGDAGFARNATIAGYYNNQAKELHSINNILVLPTIGNSWYDNWNDVAVTFSPNPTTSIGGYLERKLNYILKGDSTMKYLIVVNKDSNAVNGITVTIPSLSSVTGQISILGIAGESARSLTMTNGKFTDNFAAKSVHIYQLSGGGLLTKWKCSGSPDYLCTENATGTHNSLDACQTTCKAPPPPQKKDSDALLMLIAAMIAAHFM